MTMSDMKEQVDRAISEKKALLSSFESAVLWELVDSFKYNEKKIIEKINFYKYFGRVLLTAIPIFSLLVTSVVSVYSTSSSDSSNTPPTQSDTVKNTTKSGRASQKESPNTAKSDAVATTDSAPEATLDFRRLAALSAPPLSFILALLTVLNSVFRPGARFREACQVGIELFHWRCAFLLGLQDNLPSSSNKPEKDKPPENDSRFSKYLKEQLEVFKKLQNADIGMGLPNEK